MKVDLLIFCHALLAICLLAAAPVRAQDSNKSVTIGISGMCKPSHIAIVKEFYEQIFGKAGVEVAFKKMPLLRLQHSIETEIIDGDYLRAKETDGAYKNMVLVDSSIFPVEYAVYSTDNQSSCFKRGKVELSNCDATVGYLRGSSLIAESFLSAKYPRTYPVNSYESGLQMLGLHRLDALIGSSNVIDCLLATPEFSNTNIIKVSNFTTKPGYIYLHEKHTALAGRLKYVIDSMKADGSFSKELHELIVRHDEPSSER